MIAQNERVLLLDKDGNLFLGMAGQGILNTAKGSLDMRQVTGREYGESLKTSQGSDVKIIKVRFSDIFSGIVRGPQIILLKDAGIIAAYVGLSPGDVVVEGGTGSAAMTIFLANSVRPHGKVYTYEVRQDFIELASRNIDASGLKDFIIQRNKSLYEGIDERDVDVIVLDVPQPWKVLPHAEKALRPGGYFVSYIPTVDQVEMLGVEMQNFTSFAEFRAIEIIQRDYQVRAGATRPQTKGLMHTGFMCFARRI